MGKGGDQTTVSSESSLPREIAPFYTDLMNRAQGVSRLPYQTYQNPRLAGFSPDTEAAFGQIRGIAGAGTPDIDAALATTGNIADYQAGNIPGMDVNSYMNPYVQNVLDVQKQRATQTFGEQQAGRDTAAVQAGAFGGNRRFVQDALAQRDLNQQMQEMEATGLASAYDRATGLFQTDEENRRAAAGLGLDAATRQGALSQTRQDLGLRGAEALSGVGSRQQQRQQAGLDLAYQDFVAQRDWPNQQLSLYSQLLSGSPVSPSTTTTTTEPPPDFLSQLIGLGLGGAGIWDLLN